MRYLGIVLMVVGLGVIAACGDPPGTGFTVTVEVVNPGSVEFANLDPTLPPCINGAVGTETCTHVPVRCEFSDNACVSNFYRLTAVATSGDYRFDHWETPAGSVGICHDMPTNPTAMVFVPARDTTSACRAVFVATNGVTLVSIAVTPANPTVVSGGTVSLVATGTYSDGSTADVSTIATWTSGSSAAAVSTTGVVTTSAGLTTQLTADISASLDGVTGSTTVTITPAAVTTDSVAITPDNPSVVVGATQALTATGTRSDGSTPDLTQSAAWSSSDDTIATVSTVGTRGVVTAHAPGPVTITATVDGVSDTTTVTVTGTPAVIVSIAVTPATTTIADGRTAQFVATATKSDTTTEIITTTSAWAAGTPTIATVGTTGLATTVGNTAIGTTSITATKDGVTGTAQLTVTLPVVDSVEVTCGTGTFPLGETLPCTALGTFSDGGTSDITNSVTWSALPSARVSIATNGVLSTPVGATAGPATATATGAGFADTANVSVTAALLESIAISPHSPSLPVGSTEQLTVIGTFGDATTANVTPQATWGTTNAGVATVAAGGLCTIHGVGSAQLTATVGGFSDTTNITGIPLVTTWAIRGPGPGGGISGYIARLLAESLVFAADSTGGGIIDTLGEVGGLPSYSRLALGATIDPGTGAIVLPDGSRMIAGRDFANMTVTGWIARVAPNGTYLWQVGVSQIFIIDAIALASPTTVVASYRDISTSRPGLMTFSTANGALVTQALTDLPATLDGRMRLATARTGGDVFMANANTVFRIAATGTPAWQRTFTGATFRAIAPTAAGGVLLVGSAAGNNGFITLLDGAGTVIWQNQIGGSVSLNGVTQTPGGFTATASLTGTGAVAMLLDVNGTPTAARSYVDTSGTPTLAFAGAGAFADGTIGLGARRAAEGFTGFKLAPDLSLPGCSDATLGVSLTPFPVAPATVVVSTPAFAFTPVTTMAIVTPTVFVPTTTSLPTANACAD